MAVIDPATGVASPPSGGLIVPEETDDTESTLVDEGGWDVSAPDEPTIGGPVEALISPPDPAPIGASDREAPQVAARKAFLAWFDANAKHVVDDAELIALLEWRAKVHLDIVRRLYAERLALLIQWRSEGLTLQQIADRSRLSYARVYGLMPEDLRAKRRPQDQSPDRSTIRGTDSKAVAA